MYYGLSFTLKLWKNYFIFLYLSPSSHYEFFPMMKEMMKILVFPIGLQMTQSLSHLVMSRTFGPTTLLIHKVSLKDIIL